MAVHKRTNWLFAGSLRAGRRAAVIMSLIHSAKLNVLLDGYDVWRMKPHEVLHFRCSADSNSFGRDIIAPVSAGTPAQVRPEDLEALVARVSSLEAHSRRFEQARKAQSVDTSTESHARIALDFIRELYLVERALWDREHSIIPEHRVRVRAELSTPVMEKFHLWLEALEPKVLPQSLLGKAVRYALGQWPKLTVFLSHGEVPPDNNRCENAIHPFVVGRKGWLFSDTVKGAVASANLYSLVESAKANGVEPPTSRCSLSGFRSQGTWRISRHYCHGTARCRGPGAYWRGEYMLRHRLNQSSTGTMLRQIDGLG